MAFLEIERICISHNDCTFSLYGKCLANLLILANSSFLAKLTLANQFFSNVFFPVVFTLRIVAWTLAQNER